MAHFTAPAAGVARRPAVDGLEELGAGKLNIKEIKVIQINLNKAHAAQVELLNKINKIKSYIVLVTEPFCYKQKLSLPPRTLS